MRNIILLLACVFSTTCIAQKFQFGAKAGVNISNFTGGNFEDVEKNSLIGFHGGVFFRFQFLGFGLQPEAMISTQGARIDSVNGSYDWKLTYINIPVMAQYRFPSGFYIEAGPQVGFMIDDQVENETIENFINELDLGLAAGFGFRGKKGLGIGGRYTAGISKLGDFETASGIDPDFRNGVIQVSLYIPLTR